ncbi:hypothetical protein COEREDRAFT_79788 [Coemansia reversa NRRL 1564]|uniref:Uncharacterized protein n=1 Tax=Coemansia reversa (strain ATCC 12441 / NRRL 1564) TaxID=763665 RepID=A0A2G5BHS5_COERN|nr:hypothetical protein COEREDRAFT_79788 [Coemansia reversa NRRL 1564]|eukprot:PIA18287.1 hypothetical protein COEREDRAFT_79788 [Coemansia reversa NRRL 1564]
MDGSDYGGLWSPGRGREQQTAASPRTPQTAASPRTPQLHARMGVRGAAHTTLAALEAKHAGQQQQQQQQAPRAEGEDKWRRLGTRVLPVFNGGALQGTVEECNEAVRSCLRSSEQLDLVWPEVHAILRVGVFSLVRILHRHAGVAPRYDARQKSAGLAMPSLALLADAVRADVAADALTLVWELLSAHVLPLVEAVFLPLVQFGVAGRRRSVRAAVLVHFRDTLVLPLLPALDDVAALCRSQLPLAAPRCLPGVVQMATVLAALTPSDRVGPLYTTARALSSALQA